MIVIPMAGQSRRFAQAGYDKPKYMLDLNGQSLFSRAVASFRLLFESETFLFVFRDVAGTKAFIEAELAGLGIAPERILLHVLEAPTSGQAETVAAALRALKVPEATPLTIFNIDTIRHDYVFPLGIDPETTDGYVEVFRGEGEHWSFVRPERDQGAVGRALEVAEKQRISDLCSTGLYYFRSVGMYLSLYAETEGLSPEELQGGERYVAPLYQRALNHGHEIAYHVVDIAQLDFAGTPDEYEALRRRIPTDARIAFCLTGQVRGEAAHYAALAELARTRGADVFASVWRKTGAKTFSGAIGYKQLNRILGEVAAILPFKPQTFPTAFPKLQTQLSQTWEDAEAVLRDAFPDALLDVEDERLDLSFPHKDGNSLRMLYKMWRCNRLKRAAEKARGRRYDVVVRLRPDFMPDLSALDDMEILPETAIFKGQNDMGWIAGSEADDRLCDLFGRAAQVGYPWSYIHDELVALKTEPPIQYHDRAVGEIPQRARADQALIVARVASDLSSGDFVSERLSPEDGRRLGPVFRAALSQDPAEVAQAAAGAAASDNPGVLASALLAAMSFGAPVPDAEMPRLAAVAIALRALYGHMLKNDRERMLGFFLGEPVMAGLTRATPAAHAPMTLAEIRAAGASDPAVAALLAQAERVFGGDMGKPLARAYALMGRNVALMRRRLKHLIDAGAPQEALAVLEGSGLMGSGNFASARRQIAQMLEEAAP